MGELLDYFKERYTKNDRSETKDMMQKQRVKNAILEVCDSNIQEAGEELTFEVLPKDLQYAVSVINEEPIKSKYLIYQSSDTLFIARRKELEIDL